jgi:hypothetical protein
MPARCGLMQEAGITLIAMGTAMKAAIGSAASVRGARPICFWLRRFSAGMWTG